MANLKHLGTGQTFLQKIAETCRKQNKVFLTPNGSKPVTKQSSHKQQPK